MAAGLAFNSGGLAAAGTPTLLIAFLPCIAMCALGMCKKSDGNGSSVPDPAAQKALLKPWKATKQLSTQQSEEM